MISIIAAVSKNNVIGRDGKIPWHIPGEQKRFRELTTGKTIIIGRKSFEEIGRPLPDRKTVVLSKTKNYSAENCITVDSFSKALELLENEKEVFIAGGAEVYKAALPYAEYIYLTAIDRCFEGNVYFPDFNKDDFTVIYEQRVEGPIPYTYYTYKRISA
ncbi:MAG: dihydrofolate reductase [Clostridiaceae bacterium]|nr:dihydrofolate reductase [Clostridiaceae bacterium]